VLAKEDSDLVEVLAKEATGLAGGEPLQRRCAGEG